MRRYSAASTLVSVLPVNSFNTASWISTTRAAGADALLTGELSHHEALALREAGISAIICGHYQTEMPVLNSLLGHLQKRINVLKYNTDAVITSVVTDPYCVYTLGGVNIDR